MIERLLTILVRMVLLLVTPARAESLSLRWPGVFGVVVPQRVFSSRVLISKRYSSPPHVRSRF